MAHITDHAPAPGFLTRVWEMLVHLGEESELARRVNAISAMSDEEIRAHGTTREDLVRRTVSPYGL